jgi:hypothetical protein
MLILNKAFVQFGLNKFLELENAIGVIDSIQNLQFNYYGIPLAILLL